MTRSRPAARRGRLTSTDLSTRPSRPPRTLLRTLLTTLSGRLLAPLLALVLVATACSGGDDEPARPAADATGAGSAPAVTTSAAIGTVTGRLDKRRRAPLRAAVREVVDRWFDAAYVGGPWPRADLDRAFPGFTARARAQARRDAAVMSNHRIGRRLTSVTATRRRLQVDVLGVRGHAVGVTARVVLGFRTDGEVRRHETVRGRLRLVKVDGRWKVFAYDVSRGPARGGKGGR